MKNLKAWWAGQFDGMVPMDPEEPLEDATIKEPSVTKYVKRMQSVHAVKWDGSPEGVVEVKELLSRSTRYRLGASYLVYTNEGKVDKRQSYIEYFQDTSNHATKHMLGDYIVYDEGRIFTLNSETFERTYYDASLVSAETIREWMDKLDANP